MYIRIISYILPMAWAMPFYFLFCAFLPFLHSFLYTPHAFFFTHFFFTLCLFLVDFLKMNFFTVYLLSIPLKSTNILILHYIVKFSSLLFYIFWLQIAVLEAVSQIKSYTHGGQLKRPIKNLTFHVKKQNMFSMLVS